MQRCGSTWAAKLVVMPFASSSGAHVAKLGMHATPGTNLVRAGTVLKAGGHAVTLLYIRSSRPLRWGQEGGRGSRGEAVAEGIDHLRPPRARLASAQRACRPPPKDALPGRRRRLGMESGEGRRGLGTGDTLAAQRHAGHHQQDCQPSGNCAPHACRPLYGGCAAASCAGRKEGGRAGGRATAVWRRRTVS